MEVGGHDLGCGGVLDFAARGGEAGGTEWEEVGWGGLVGPVHKMHAWCCIVQRGLTRGSGPGGARKHRMKHLISFFSLFLFLPWKEKAWLMPLRMTRT